MKKIDKELRRQKYNYRRSFDGVAYRCATDAFVHPRVLVDRMIRGVPLQQQIKEHTPLPPDGENDDYEVGTEEVIDLVDAQELKESAEKKIEEYNKKVEDAKKKAEEERIESLVTQRLEKLNNQE